MTRSETAKQDEIARDTAIGVLASVGAAIPIGITFVIFAMMVYFDGGGTLGGYGAGPSAPASWAIMAQYVLFAIAVILDVMVGVWVYKWRRRKRN